MATKKDLFLPVFLLRQNLCTLCVPGVYLLGWDCDTCEASRLLSGGFVAGSRVCWESPQ
jgi:hypothetical protein